MSPQNKSKQQDPVSIRRTKPATIMNHTMQMNKTRLERLTRPGTPERLVPTRENGRNKKDDGLLKAKRCVLRLRPSGGKSGKQLDNAITIVHI